MNSNIEELIKENKYNQNLQQFKIKYNSNKYDFNSNEIHRKVNFNKDFEKYLKAMENTLDYYQNKKEDSPGKLVEYDIEVIELSIANYECALGKLLQCYDNPNCKFEYNYSEINDYINKLQDSYEIVKEIRLKKACQWDY